MNALYVAVFVCLAACANAKPSGHGVVVAGPSGIVTGHGAVGPIGYGLHGVHGVHDDGQWHGEGLWESGALHGGAWAGHAGAYAGHGAGVWGGHAVVAPHAVVAHGVAYGHGHGVAVVGPHTVPAVIAGPSGKIVADGLYGVGHGHHW